MCGTVGFSDAIASSFVAKVCYEVFAHFHDISMRNCLSGPSGRIPCNNPFDIQENEAAPVPDSALTSFAILGLG
jgi:hypothetical protein